ncbi:MAG: hypothetical protein KDM91_04020, partial [Verrucomicrobiae bacterium]|nr:hypothetical protein [Verrucomicrobiae bacterium]
MFPFSRSLRSAPRRVLVRPPNMDPNPFHEDDLHIRNRPDSCTLVIFGASGDLTHRKLIPALYTLAAAGDLPAGLRVVGFARREKTDDEFRAGLEKLNREIVRGGHQEKLWEPFSRSIEYHQSEFQDAEGYQRLRRRLDEIDANGGSGNRLYYLASAPEYFDDILTHLRGAGLSEPRESGWSRVVVEKPFGTDLPTARQLNRIIADT